MKTVLDIGVIWCSFFNRGFWSSRYNLNNAYRPPSLFSAKMLQEGHRVTIVQCDEELTRCGLDGTVRSLQEEVDLLYVMSHGIFDAGGYALWLHEQSWRPAAGPLGSGRLKVAVFDTCCLIDSNVEPNWKVHWSAAAFGPNLRLLLGFDGPAFINRGSAERGLAFAENLIDGQSFADAWITAVDRTTLSQHSRAIALGVGATQADAEHVLSHAAVDSMPGPRGPGPSHVELR